MKYILTILLAFSIAQAAQDGNGGDVLTCPKEIRKPIELLDFYEWGKVGVHYSLGDKNLSVREKVGIYLRRIGRLAPERAKAYAEAVEPLLADYEIYLADNTKTLGVVTRITDEELQDIIDSEHLTYPLGCKVEQLIIRKKPRFEEHRLYTINLRLLKDLDNDNIAGMMMHEVIYGDAKDTHKHPDSVLARYFNAKVSTAAFEDYTLKEYVALIYKAELKYFEFDGLLLTAHASAYPTFHPNDMLYESTVAMGKSLQVGSDVAQPTYVAYYPSGRIKTYASRDTRFEQDKVRYFSATTDFYPDGKLHRTSADHYRSINKINFLGKVKKAKTIVFNHTGEIIGRLEESATYGDFDFLNYDKTPLVPQTVVDDYADHPRKIEEQVGMFVEPTYKGFPILGLMSGRYHSIPNEVCKKLGFERVLVARTKRAPKKGSAWVIYYSNAFEEVDLEKHRKLGWADRLSLLICDGFAKE